MISKVQQKKLLSLARKSIESSFEHTRPAVKEDFMKEKRGVFVTLKIKDELRGCIGFPEPVYPLGEAVIESARQAAFNDPRFPELEKDELKQVKIEMSVLTKPEEVKAKTPLELVKKVKVGEDGLIVRRGMFSGLLLPQVAAEWKWNEEEFLNQTCIKAGLPFDAWKDADTKVYKFQADVFSE
jgi:hypothetical protein